MTRVGSAPPVAARRRPAANLHPGPRTATQTRRHVRRRSDRPCRDRIDDPAEDGRDRRHRRPTTATDGRGEAPPNRERRRTGRRKSRTCHCLLLGVAPELAVGVHRHRVADGRQHGDVRGWSPSTRRSPRGRCPRARRCSRMAWPSTRRRSRTRGRRCTCRRRRPPRAWRSRRRRRSGARAAARSPRASSTRCRWRGPRCDAAR